MESRIRPPRTFDVVIIGGGLAGAAAGVHLATYGYAVAIVERTTATHHKICGEFLSPETLPYLHELGIDLDALHASSLNAFAVYSRHFHLRRRFSASARGVSRYALDAACLARAQQTGCTIFRGAQVEGYNIDASQTFHVRTSRSEMSGRTIFLATGKHDLKAIHTRHGLDNAAIGFKMHYQMTVETRQSLQQAVAIYYFRGGYAGLCEIENNTLNFCCIIDKHRFRRIGNSYETMLAALQTEAPALGHVLGNATPAWPKPLAMTGIPYGYVLQPHTAPNDSGVYPVGDQCAVIPSLTGSGMAIALFTARLAAAQYHQHGNTGVATYARTCFQTIHPRMRLAYPLHALTRSPLLADAVVGLLTLTPALSDHLLHKTRMPSVLPAL